jgi:predicted PurR-regulated permease PerM
VWQRAFFVLSTSLLVVAALYFAQRVLILLALAVLISFVLQPLVAVLQRGGLPRLFAVLASVVLAFAVVSGLGWIFVIQIQSLSADWPMYWTTIVEKIKAIDPTGEVKLMENIEAGAQELIKRLLETAIAPVLDTLLTIVFLVALVIFVLLRREDLRNRIIRLTGHDRRTIVTTHALDEGAQRISRYLIAQLLINASFGTLLALGLWVCGMRYVALWGFLAMVMRFIPYLGTWVAMLLPALFSVATSDGWVQPLEVAGLFLVLELLTANVAEPLVFGMSSGVSPLALIVAAIFWAWLWGPIGLLLSTPLTACLYVLGRYIPHLEFLEVLLGDEPALATSVNYYQRLLARDQDEAFKIVEQQLAKFALEEVFDTVLVPALVLAKRDGERGDLSEDGEDYILAATRTLLANLNDLATPARQIAVDAKQPTTDGSADAAAKAAVLGVPAMGEIDELALDMMRQVLVAAGRSMQVASTDMLTSEILALLEKEEHAVVVIAALPPGGVAQTRYLCKRLRARFPALKILVGRWGCKETTENTRKRLTAAGANLVAMSLTDTRRQLIPLAQSLEHIQEPAPAFNA